MPIITTIAASSARSKGFSAIGRPPGGPHWFSTIFNTAGSNPADNRPRIRCHTNGNVYVGCGRLIKYNSAGTVQWQKAPYRGIIDLAIDSYEQINTTYSTGNYNPFYQNVFGVVQYNADGDFNWGKNLGWDASSAYGNSGSGRAIAVDGNSNIYIYANQGVYDYLAETALVSYDASGNMRYKRMIGYRSLEAGSSYDYAGGVAADSSGNVYTGTRTEDPSYRYRGLISKFNTSATRQWTKGFGDDQHFELRDMDADSSGNVYMCGRWWRDNIAFDYQDNVFLLTKHNTSGALQWERYVTSGDTDFGECAISSDSSGNVYFCGTLKSGSIDSVLIVKFNSSGNVLWQRKITPSTGLLRGSGIDTDATGNFYFSAGWSSNNTTVIGKLPGGGELTGSYTIGDLNIQYSAATQEIGNPYYANYDSSVNVWENSTGYNTNSLQESEATYTTTTSSNTVITTTA